MTGRDRSPARARAAGAARPALLSLLLPSLLLLAAVPGSAGTEPEAASPRPHRPPPPSDTVPAPPSAEDSLPPGVTAETVRRGGEVYRGAGLCYSCHGTRGRGVPRAGSSLVDGEWHHTDADYRSLVFRIANGVTADRSFSGMPMPPRGGAELTADEVRAVAAYVWWISRRKGRPGREEGDRSR